MAEPAYERLPPKFLEGIFLAPHNFSSPQNPLHGQMVDFQLRNDLYEQCFRKIEPLEFGWFSSDDSYLKLQDIRECDGKESIAERIKDYLQMNKEEDEVIRCEQWTINNSGKSKSLYKFKFVQSKTDRFYSLLYPPRLRDYLHLWLKGQT